MHELPSNHIFHEVHKKSEHRKAEHRKSESKKVHSDKRTAKKSTDKVKKAREHYEKVKKTSKPGEGKRFKALSGSIEKSYIAKGKSPAEAKRIAGATAGKIGRKEYGKAKMAKWSARGRK